MNQFKGVVFSLSVSKQILFSSIFYIHAYIITFRVYESMQALPPYLMDDVHLYSIENLINVSLCLSTSDQLYRRLIG